MSECTVLKFPVPKQEPQIDYEPTPAETLRGIWMSLRYLEDEATRLGQQELAFLVGLASMNAGELCIPSQAAE